MKQSELVELIAERAASDPEFAGLIERRHAGDVSVDRAIQAALPATAVPRQYLVTYRGIRRVLGAHEGRIFVQSLRAFAGMVSVLPETHPAYDELWWLAELLPDLDTGGDGIDIGDPATRGALRALAGPMAALLPEGPSITAAHCDALDAASSTKAPVPLDLLSNVLSAEV
jgi:hypothetical protein